MSVSVFEHGFLSGLLGDAETARLFSVEADIAAMARFEAALAEAEAAERVISSAAAAAISATCQSFAPDVAALNEATARDGVVVAEFVRQLRKAVGEAHGKSVHFGATSQDVIDTSLMLRLKSVMDIFASRINNLSNDLQSLEATFGTRPLMGRTRMQQAIEITVADRIAAWRLPVAEAGRELADLQGKVLQLQFGGAAGTLEKLGDKAPTVTDKLANSLGLASPPRNWHTRRGGLVAFADWLSRLTGGLGKMGQDIALMAQNEVGEVALSGGGGSSAMPHKQNPVKAEVLVSLARFNATQVSAMHHALIHENERSGAAWTLEWMVLPQMAVCTGAALKTAAGLVASVKDMGAGAK